MKGNLLEGSLPPSLSSLKGIQYLDLSRNNLSGELPEFLERFDLYYLNLSFNDFEGEVPRDGAFKNASAVSVIGNNKLCGGIPELRLPLCNISVSIKKGRSFPKLKVTLSVVLGLSGFILLFCVLLFCWLRNKKKEAQLNKSEELFLKVSYQTLLNATDGFSLANLIGEGSFGSVYKGIIDQTGGFVAIKVLNLLRRGASKSFLAECEALRNIRHRNLVKVLTACSGIDFRGNDFKALVYEFMSNGNLDKWLHPTSMTEEPRSLNLLQRLNIATDVADALEYLHNYCQPPVVHCDLKPSNILLDEEMIRHVGDFGLAKFLPIEMNNMSDNQSSSTGIRGTIGYAAPENGMGTEVSAWGDVYSYGILLLEMFTGKEPTHDMFKDSLNLHGYVKDGLPARAVEIADPTLLQEGIGLTILEDPQSSNGVYECLSSVFSVGVACSADLPRERMSIKDVAAELHSIRNKLVKTSRRGDPTEVMINAS